jgi:hypothetical protein
MVYTLLFFSLQNVVCFIIVTYLVPVLFTFYIQVCYTKHSLESGGMPVLYRGCMLRNC